MDVDAMTSALARAHETHRVVVAGAVASDLACATRVPIDVVACVTLGRTLFDQLAHGSDNLAERRRARHGNRSQVPVVLQTLAPVRLRRVARRPVQEVDVERVHT